MSRPGPERRFLIDGGGLAGCLLTWLLAQRGCQVRLAATRARLPATPVGAGIINPLAGRRLNPTPGFSEKCELAAQLYRSIEAKLGCRILYPRPILRVLANPEQSRRLKVGSPSPGERGFIAERYPAGHFHDSLADPWGAFLTKESGWVDFHALTTAVHRWAESQDMLDNPEAGVSSIQNWPKIFCGGWQDRLLGGMGKLLEPAKGEIAVIRLQRPLKLGLPGPAPIVNRGFWLKPVDSDPTVFEAGSTHIWSNLEDPVESPEFARLNDQLRAFLKSDFEILERRVGVRPSSFDRLPIAGPLPGATQENQFVLNGLGGQGALYAPWAAHCLVSYLVDGGPVPPEIWSLRRCPA